MSPEWVRGVSILGSDIYITHSPCIHCLKVLINTGIGRVCYGKPYKLDEIRELVERSGITLQQVLPQGPSAQGSR